MAEPNDIPPEDHMVDAHNAGRALISAGCMQSDVDLRAPHLEGKYVNGVLELDQVPDGAPSPGGAGVGDRR